MDMNSIGGAMVSVPGRVNPKTMKLVFLFSPLSLQHLIRRKSKYWVVWNQDNMSECGYMSIRGLLFQ